MKVFTGRIISTVSCDNSIFKINFCCFNKFSFEPGQFISVLVPLPNGGFQKRLYSMASSFEESKVSGFELCIKTVQNGLGSSYLSKLKVNDLIQFIGPYGHFKFQTGRGRPVVFIGTGSGVAPLRSIAQSSLYQSETVPFAVALLGFRNRAEVPYFGDFEKLNFSTRYALSREPDLTAFPQSKRVTQILSNFKASFPWTTCDYYMCGNPDMIQEVLHLLKQRNVPDDAIFYESFAAITEDVPVAA